MRSEIIFISRLAGEKKMSSLVLVTKKLKQFPNLILGVYGLYKDSFKAEQHCRLLQEVMNNPDVFFDATIVETDIV